MAAERQGILEARREELAEELQVAGGGEGRLATYSRTEDGEQRRWRRRWQRRARRSRRGRPT